MPDFVATLVAATLFCTGLIVLNALTRVAQHAFALGIDENGLPQLAGAALLAGWAWSRLRQNQAGVANE